MAALLLTQGPALLGAAGAEPEAQEGAPALDAAAREALVQRYLDVFRGDVPLDATPGQHDELSLQDRAAVFEGLLEAMKADPQLAGDFDPAVAGPKLGLSTPEDPLVDREGQPITRERVEAVYRGLVQGLVFDRVGMFDSLQQAVEQLVPPSPQPPPELDAPPELEGQTVPDPVRAELEAEPLAHWANEVPGAEPPEGFDLELLGGAPPPLPPGTEALEWPEIPAFPAPAPPEPLALGPGLLDAAPPEAWLDPEFRLELPALLRALAQRAGDPALGPLLPLADLARGELEPLGQVVMEELPEVATSIAAIDGASGEVDAALGGLAAPLPLLAVRPEATLRPEVVELLQGVSAELAKTQYRGTFNGQPVEGLVGVPAPVDVDGDEVPDYVLHVAFVPAVVDPRDGLVRLTPRVAVEGTHRFDAVRDAGPALPPMPVPPLPAVPAPLPGDAPSEGTEATADPGGPAMAAPEVALTLPGLDPAALAGLAPEAPAEALAVEATGLPGVEAAPGPSLPDLEATLAPRLPGVATTPPPPLHVVECEGYQEGSDRLDCRSAPKPVDVVVAFYRPNSDTVAVVAARAPGGVDHLEATFPGPGLALEAEASGAPGPLDVVVAHAAGAGLTARGVSGSMGRLALAASGVASSAEGRAALHVEPLRVDPKDPAPWTASVRHDRDGRGLALAAGSSRMVPVDVSSEGGALRVQAPAGTAALAVARQEFTAGSSAFLHRGLLLDNAAPFTEAVLELEGFRVEADAAGSAVRAVVGEVEGPAYRRATWAEVTGAGEEFRLGARDGGVDFASESQVGHVRAVAAPDGARFLRGAVGPGVFRVEDGLVAFHLRDAKSASAQMRDGGVALQVGAPSEAPFLVEVLRGLDTRQFLFTNLPKGASLDIGADSVSIGGSGPIRRVDGTLLRPLDGALAAPTKTALVLQGLNGSASFSMAGASLNVFAAGTLADATAVASNVQLPDGTYAVPAAPSAHHVVAELQGAARQYRAHLAGIVAPILGFGNLTALLSGAVGNFSIDLSVQGPVCWKLGNNAASIQFCISNIPEHVGFDINLLPHPIVRYEASEKIRELTLTLASPGVGLLFYIKGIPKVVQLALAPDGLTLSMDERLEGIGFAAELTNPTSLVKTSLAAGVEDLPKTLRLGWGQGGVAPLMDRGDFIGKVVLFLSRPTLGFDLTIEHLPPVSIAWSEAGLSLDLSGDRIGSVIAHLFLAPVDAAKNLAAELEARGIPGLALSWGAAGGTLSTTDRLDLLRLSAEMGKGSASALRVSLSVEGVPKIQAGTFDAAGFGLGLIGGGDDPDLRDADAFRFPNPSRTWNDVVSSIRVPAGCKAVLYEAIAFGGASKEFAADAAYVGDDFNDKSSSIRVSSLGAADCAVTVYEAGGFGGAARAFRSPDDPDLRDADAFQFPNPSGTWNDIISSIRVPAGCKAVLYENIGFGGTSTEFTADAASVGWFNDLASSIRVSSLGAADCAVTVYEAGDFQGASRTFSMAARIDAVRLSLTTPKLTFLAEAEGIPGIAVAAGAAGGTIATTAPLDLVHLLIKVGAGAPTLHLELAIEGVPRIAAGSWGSSGLSLGFPSAGDSVRKVRLEMRTPQLYFVTDAAGVPGVSASWAQGSGTGRLSTQGTLGSIDVRAMVGPRHFSLENGGAGPSGDATAYRGKYFTDVKPGVITELCVYVVGPGTSVEVAVQAAPQLDEYFIRETLTGLQADAWNCKAVDRAWGASTLFIYKTGGDAKVGYDFAKPHDSWYSDDTSHGSWNADSFGKRRGYRVTLASAPSQALENGGAGPGEDAALYRGKFFEKVQPGVITELCVYIGSGGGGGSVLVAVKPSPSPGGAAFYERIDNLQSFAWNCKPVDHPWSASTLFIYNADGAASVGYDDASPNDSWYSSDGGISWSVDPNPKRRGYRLTVVDASTPVLTGPGLAARLYAADVPAITSGAWDSDSFDLTFQGGKAGQLLLEFVLETLRDQDDLLLRLDARGLPTLSLQTGASGVTFQAPGGIDSVEAVLRKGTFAYDPAAYEHDFLGVWLRPGSAEVGVSARITGLKGVAWRADESTRTQHIDLGFTSDKNLLVFADILTPALVAQAGIFFYGLPASLSLAVRPEGLSLQGSKCNPCGVTPWLQASVSFGTPAAYDATPEPPWPFETANPTTCPRRLPWGSASDPCGIRGHATLDPGAGGIATKWKVYTPLPTSLSFTTTNAGGVPSYTLDTGVSLGKLDLRVQTLLPRFSGADPDLRNNPRGPSGDWNDAISSLRVSPGCRAVLFAAIHYGAQQWVFGGETPNLVDLGVNDMASSLLLEPLSGGTAGCSLTVYEHTNFQGASTTFTTFAAEDRNLADDPRRVPDGDWNDVVRSLRVSPRNACSAVLFPAINHGGTANSFNQDTSSLGSDLAAQASSIAVIPFQASGCTVTVYDGENYQGASRAFNSPAAHDPDFSNDPGPSPADNWEDIITSLTVSAGCTAILYEHRNYNAQATAGLRTLEGAYPSGTSHNILTSFNDKASSIHVLPFLGFGTNNPRIRADGHCDVTVYEHEFYGQSKTFSATAATDLDFRDDRRRLPDKDWNNAISSIKVSPGCTVTLYDDPNYGGGSATFGAGDHGTLYPGGLSWGFDDRAASLAVAAVGGAGSCSVTAYEDWYFGGASTTFTGTTTTSVMAVATVSNLPQRLTLTETISSQVLENGGSGPDADANAFRGKYFPNVRPGTITQLCVHAASGTSVDVAVGVAPGAGARFTATIPIARPGGWNCQAVSQRWSDSTLFIYKTGGDAAVSLDNGAPYDSRYSTNGGSTWGSDNWRRGFRAAFDGTDGGQVTDKAVNPSFALSTSETIGKVFLGLRFDGQFGGTAPVEVGEPPKPTGAGFPIWFSVSDVPTSVSLTLGKDDWGGDTFSAPTFTYSASASTLDAMAYVDVGLLFQLMPKHLIAAALDKGGAPPWLASLARYDATGHLFLLIQDIPHDGIAVRTEGQKVVIDPAPTHGDPSLLDDYGPNAGTWNDAVKFVSVPNGCVATLYTAINFQGEAKSFTTGDGQYVGDDFNKMASSVRVYRQDGPGECTATFYDERYWADVALRVTGHDHRLTRFFADFEMRFNNAFEKKGCVVCVSPFGVDINLTYSYKVDWFFAIRTLSLLIEDLGYLALDAQLESKVDIDGKLLFHFRAAQGAKAKFDFSLWVEGIGFVFCLCFETPTFSYVIDPGFISWQKVDFSIPVVTVAGYAVGVRGTYPGNWGFDQRIALPEKVPEWYRPHLPFRGLALNHDVAPFSDPYTRGVQETYNLILDPRLLVCGGDWQNPEVACLEVGRLLPVEFVVAWKAATEFSFRIDTWKV